MNKLGTTLLATLLALALVATACGGSDDEGSGGDDAGSGADQALVEAVAAQMTGNGDVPPGVDVDCMAAAMVNGLGGADGMAELGLTVESIEAGEEPDSVELAPEEARALASDALDCGLGEVIVEGMTGGGMSTEDAACLLENIDQDIIVDLMATEFMNAEDAAEISATSTDAMISGLIDAMSTCDLDPTALGG